jgi:hypothetical protein
MAGEAGKGYYWKGYYCIIKRDKRKKFKRKRLGKVIRELICVAGKLVRHSGQLVLKIYEGEAIVPVFLRLDGLLDSL